MSLDELQRMLEKNTKSIERIQASISRLAGTVGDMKHIQQISFEDSSKTISELLGSLSKSQKEAHDQISKEIEIMKSFQETIVLQLNPDKTSSDVVGELEKSLQKMTDGINEKLHNLEERFDRLEGKMGEVEGLVEKQTVLHYSDSELEGTPFKIEMAVSEFPSLNEKVSALGYLGNLKSEIQHYLEGSDNEKVLADFILDRIKRARTEVYEISSGITPSVNDFSRHISERYQSETLYDREKLKTDALSAIDELIRFHKNRPVFGESLEPEILNT